MASYLGIDLGTTNSVAVLTDGERAEAVRTNDGGPLLPSVVRIDARHNAVVGARARRFLDTDPDNTRSEFKRLMGAGRTVAFKAAQVERSPEELSAVLLKELRACAKRTLGHAPTAAVVTVPALFELPQIRATSEAARLAGFERVEHLQEPVASALTAGWTQLEAEAPWLVYDLGGGTFDVSLLETREGVLRVVGHDGDNFLGGRDMDARLLEHVLGALGTQYGRAFHRTDPELATMTRRLRVACEDAKIELGRGVDGSVVLAEPVVVSGEEIIVDVPVSRSELEALVLPVVDRSIEVCLRLCARHGVSPAALGRLVLVGGPTAMSVLRNRLQERLGIPLAHDVDPMTAVAEGAARFAAEHDIATRNVAVPAALAAPGSQVWLQYPSVSGDLYPFVVGRAPGVAHVQVKRPKDGWTSAREAVDEENAFVVQVELTPRALNHLTLEGFDAAGKPMVLTPNSIAIRHGLSLADPPLSRTIGIALADDTVMVYFERGAPLPSRKTFRMHTSLTVRPGDVGSAVTVPIVQGEVGLARLCRLVGHIQLLPARLRAPLPAGSPVDVVLELDRGGHLSARAELPSQGISFDGVLVLEAPNVPLEQLEENHRAQRRRIEHLYVDPELGPAERQRVVAIDPRLDDVQTELDAARGGDHDAAEKARRILLDIDADLAEVETVRIWPALEREASHLLSIASYWTERTGSALDRQMLEESARSLQRARATKNTAEYSKRIDAIDRLATTALMRDPAAAGQAFANACHRLAEMRDPKAAKEWIAKGEAAERTGDLTVLRQSTYALWNLLPPSEQIRQQAHGSGVQR